MLTFEKWYETEHDVETNYEINESILEEVYASYLQYKDGYPLDTSFLDSWDFLYSHPVFKGMFKECLDICPVNDETLGECILLETSVYELNDGSYEWFKDEFIRVYDDEIDVWNKTFEGAIKILSELVKSKYGEYTEEESGISEYELSFGKEGGKAKYYEHQERVRFRIKNFDY